MRQEFGWGRAVDWGTHPSWKMAGTLLCGLRQAWWATCLSEQGPRPRSTVHEAREPQMGLVSCPAHSFLATLSDVHSGGRMFWLSLGQTLLGYDCYFPEAVGRRQPILKIVQKLLDSA